MKSHVRYALILVAGLSLSACRQADGPVPTPKGDTQSEIADIGRDLLSIAARDGQASADLADDLRKYTELPHLRAAIDELSRRTASVVARSKLTEQTAQRLAHNLWLAVVAREMSERQVEALQNNLQTLLMSAGVDEESAQPAAAQVGEVQRLATTRQRRWYEVF